MYCNSLRRHHSHFHQDLVEKKKKNAMYVCAVDWSLGVTVCVVCVDDCANSFDGKSDDELARSYLV